MENIKQQLPTHGIPPVQLSALQTRPWPGKASECSAGANDQKGFVPVPVSLRTSCVRTPLALRCEIVIYKRFVSNSR